MMVRALYPIDLVPFLFALGRMPANEAVSCGSLSRRSPTSPEALLEQWLPLRTRRQTWVVFQRGRPVGLLSARTSGNSGTWDIDHLHADKDKCLALMDTATAAIAKQGVRRIFLRLPSDSPLVHEARRSGFAPYKMGAVYRHTATPVRSQTVSSGPYRLRAVSKHDDFQLFDLYRAAVPDQVRAAEGMTIGEWQETRDMPAWPEKHREYVLRNESQVVGWLRVSAAGRTGCFTLMYREEDSDGPRSLVDHALVCLSGHSPLFCIAWAFQGRLLRLLADLGFEHMGECSALVKEMAVKASEPGLMPIQA